MVMVEVTVALVTPIVDESNNSHGVWAQETVHAAHAGRVQLSDTSGSARQPSSTQADLAVTGWARQRQSRCGSAEPVAEGMCDHIAHKWPLGVKRLADCIALGEHAHLHTSKKH